MGVLACARYGCENIMCDRMSYKYGYLCDDCIAELKSKPFVDINDFLQTPAPESDDSWERMNDEEFTIR